VKLILIPHSEPDPGRDVLDPPLTENGRRLAAATGEWLAGEGDRLRLSSTSRAGRRDRRPDRRIGRRPRSCRGTGLAEFGGGQEYVRSRSWRRTGDARWTGHGRR